MSVVDNEPRRHGTTWPSWSQRSWFGDEPEPSTSALPIEDTVADLYKLVARSYDDARAAASSNRLANEMWCALDLPQPHEPSTPGEALRVVLMGRTMAGKSTLLAALSGRHTDRIGDGRQRYSRDVFSAPIRDLPHVELVDTPGVGAHDGIDDYYLAMNEAETADVVVWVASNDSFQEETAKALRTLAVRGKPIIVALNCRKALSDEFSREDFLDDPESVFAQQEGNFRRIKAHLSDAGVTPVAEVAIHAAAAHSALTDTARSERWTAASHISELRTHLVDQYERHREQRRLLRLVDGVRDQAADIAARLERAAYALSQSAKRGREAAGDLRSRYRREIERTQETLDTAVVRLIAQLRDWPRSLNLDDFGKSLNSEWKRQVESLLDELQSGVTAALGDLQKRLTKIGADVEYEWSNLPAAGHGFEGLPDFKSVKWNRTVQMTVAGGVTAATVGGAALGAKIAVVYGFAAGPLAPLVWVGGAVAGAIAGALAKPVVNLAKRVFKGEAYVLRARQDAVREQIIPVLDSVADDVKKALNGQFQDLQRSVGKSYHDAENLCGEARTIAEKWRHGSDELHGDIDRIDTATTAALLRTQGRQRLASGLIRASRNPGVCVLATMTPPAFTEAALFPPDPPEPLSCSPEVLANRHSAQEIPFTLGLSGQIGLFTQWTPDSSIVAISGAVAPGIREAWSAVLSLHSGKAVSLIDCSANEGGTS